MSSSSCWTSRSTSAPLTTSWPALQFTFGLRAQQPIDGEQDRQLAGLAPKPTHTNSSSRSSSPSSSVVRRRSTSVSASRADLGHLPGLVAPWPRTAIAGAPKSPSRSTSSIRHETQAQYSLGWTFRAAKHFRVRGGFGTSCAIDPDRSLSNSSTLEVPDRRITNSRIWRSIPSASTCGRCRPFSSHQQARATLAHQGCGACRARPAEPGRPLSSAPSGPLALAHHRHAAAVGVDAVDVDLARADHPVDVDQALVAALRRDLLRRQLGAVDEAFRVALAERDVAGGVLVEQRVVEQDAALPRSARNAAPAPLRRAGARPRRCRAPCSAPPRRATPWPRRCGRPRSAPAMSSISVPW